MSQTKTQRELMDEYIPKYLSNKKLEWLIEHGKTHQNIYFKGATGDRYTIYIATKRNKSTVDFHKIYNTYDHGTSDGTHIATIKNCILKVINGGNPWTWRTGCGDLIKQLMRQGVCNKQYPWKIRWCRSAFFMKVSGPAKENSHREFTPWIGMRIDLKTGFLVNKPNKSSIKEYKKAKASDARIRKANALSNKNNTEALERYRKAGGNTVAARSGWNKDESRWITAEVGDGTKNINWDLIPMDDIFKHRNATLRSNILEHYGINTVLESLEYETIDIDFIDGREYKLLDVEIPDNSTGDQRMQKCLYLQMINPSTGESHFEGIANVGSWNAPAEATVKAALSWRDGDKMMITGNEWGNNDGKKIAYIKPIILT